MKAFWPAILPALLAACTSSSPPAAPGSAAPEQPIASAVSEDPTIASLLARPLRIPALAPGAPCPVSTPTLRSPVAQPANAMGLGTGPLYPITPYIGQDATLRLTQTPGPDGLYELKVVWASAGAWQEPAVVRVGRLDGEGRGRVRLFYEPAAARGDAVVFRLHGRPADFPSSTEVSGPGCYAYQVDGVTFDEVIVFRVITGGPVATDRR